RMDFMDPPAADRSHEEEEEEEEEEEDDDLWNSTWGGTRLLLLDVPPARGTSHMGWRPSIGHEGLSSIQNPPWLLVVSAPFLCFTSLSSLPTLFASSALPLCMSMPLAKRGNKAITKSHRRRGIRRSPGRGGVGGRVANGVGVDLALVEAAVAVAGGTDEGCAGSLLTGRHELPATVHCVSAYAGSMVLPALLVLNHHLLLLGCGAIGVLPGGLVMKAHSGVRGVERRGWDGKKETEGGGNWVEKRMEGGDNMEVHLSAPLGGWV
ncbi:hypothetical protein BHE74_00024762, partial [Ensete ventricosum]